MFYTAFPMNIYEDNYCYNDGNNFNIKNDLNITSGKKGFFIEK
jgi:hypothetical protein